MQSCLRVPDTYSAIPPGIWRATLHLSASPSSGVSAAFDEHTEGLLPFNFVVEYTQEDTFHIIIQNGPDQIRLEDIAFGRDRATARDTLRIEFPAHGGYISALYEEDAIEGYWHPPDSGSAQRVRMKALHAKPFRFDTTAAQPAVHVGGSWRCTFGLRTDDPYEAIATLEQNGAYLGGTITRDTGDFGYLEGAVIDDRMFLSYFDGMHAYLFEAKLLDEGTLTGVFRSGNQHKIYWVASRVDTLQ